MSEFSGFALLAIIVVDLYMLATGRLGACIRASGVQGVLLALLPLAVVPEAFGSHLIHVVSISAGTLLLKAAVIPWLLFRALRGAGIRREVEPFVSQHVTLLLGGCLVGLAFWASTKLPLPQSNLPALLVPAALTTVLLGFLVIVSRRKAITQVVGYLMMENGVFVFGLGLTHAMPFVVELGILLDVLVGIFVFGIVIHHINAEFDHIDTGALSELKD